MCNGHTRNIAAKAADNVLTKTAELLIWLQTGTTLMLLKLVPCSPGINGNAAYAENVSTSR